MVTDPRKRRVDADPFAGPRAFDRPSAAPPAAPQPSAPTGISVRRPVTDTRPLAERAGSAAIGAARAYGNAVGSVYRAGQSVGRGIVNTIGSTATDFARGAGLTDQRFTPLTADPAPASAPLSSAAPPPGANGVSTSGIRVTRPGAGAGASVQTGTPARPGDVNTFTGSNGVTRVVRPDGTATGTASAQGSFNVVPSSAITRPGLAAAASALGATTPSTTPVARPVAAPAALPSVQRPPSASNGISSFAARMVDPRSNEAEMIRRLGLDQTKQTPSQRALMSQLLSGAADSGATDTQVAGNLANTAMRGQVDYALGAQQNEGQLAAITQQARVQRPQVTYQMGANGRLVALDGATATPVTGADGSGFTPGQPPATLSPADRAKQIAELYPEVLAVEMRGVAADDAEGAAAAQDRVLARIEQLLGPGPSANAAGAATAPAGAIQELRADPSRAAEFDRKYGAGAAARALGG